MHGKSAKSLVDSAKNQFIDLRGYTPNIIYLGLVTGEALAGEIDEPAVKGQYDGMDVLIVSREHFVGFGQLLTSDFRGDPIANPSPIDDIPFHNDTCTRCGSELIPGKAIDNTLTGSGDFHDKDEAVTLSVGGTGNLIDCLKCSDDMCGRRFYETGTAFHSEVEA